MPATDFHPKICSWIILLLLIGKTKCQEEAITPSSTTPVPTTTVQEFSTQSLHVTRQDVSPSTTLESSSNTIQHYSIESSPTVESSSVTAQDATTSLSVDIRSSSTIVRPITSVTVQSTIVRQDTATSLPVTTRSNSASTQTYTTPSPVFTQNYNTRSTEVTTQSYTSEFRPVTTEGYTTTPPPDRFPTTPPPNRFTTSPPLETTTTESMANRSIPTIKLGANPPTISSDCMSSESLDNLYTGILYFLSGEFDARVLGRSRQLHASSCGEIFNHNPWSKSGLYWIRNGTETVQQYCIF